MIHFRSDLLRRLSTTSHHVAQRRVLWRSGRTGYSSELRILTTTTSPAGTPKKDDDDDKNDKNPTTPAPSQPPSAVPGVALSVATACAGFGTASVASDMLSIPVSGIPVSILLGMAVKNTVGYSDATFKPGITFSTKTILQGGIVCVAAKLSFLEVLTTGGTGIPVVAAAVGAGLWFIPWAGRRAALPREMTLLLTAGTSICGVTAITALAPAIRAPPRDIAVAVANTVAFGTVGMLAYPYLFHFLCSSPEQVGMCLGVAIHDTSQVLGSALSYKETYGDEVAFKVAAVTKLMRNLGLAVAIPSLTYFHQTALAEKDNTTASEQQLRGQPESMSGLTTFSKYVPNFLIAFLGVSAVRSAGDMLIAGDSETYTALVQFVGNDLSKYALGTAMAGVGLSTSASSLRGVGWKPFAVGGLGALVVGGTGFATAALLVG